MCVHDCICVFVCPWCKYVCMCVCVCRVFCACVFWCSWFVFACFHYTRYVFMRIYVCVSGYVHVYVYVFVHE